MAEIPEENYAQPWTPDTRNALPLVGDERTILTAVLDWHRQTFELKCAGVPPERLSEKNVPPSGLSCTAWSATWHRWSGDGSANSRRGRCAVEWHLRKVFIKLGISSRHQLGHRALTGRPARS